MRILIALFLLTLASFAQVPAVPDPTTGVPMQGRIAPQGNFPLLSGGNVTMPADADYTLVYPQFTGSVLQILSAVPLTTTRTVTHNLPANQAQRFGFEFTVQNATSGGRDIVFKGSTGAGVTIPNGQALVVMFDGTNYVSVGGGNSNLLGGHALPPLTSGYLHWDGSAWNFATPTGGGGGSTYLNSILGATATNQIDNGRNTQTWLWGFTGSPVLGLSLQESLQSTSGSTLFHVSSTGNSNTIPFKAEWRYSGGMQISGTTGNIETLGLSKFVGPVQIPSLVSASSLRTDSGGNIIAGTGGGGGGASIMIDAHDYGVKADGHPITCNIAQGGTTAECWSSIPGWPVNFSQNDVGKPFIVYGAGPPVGQVRGDITVSGGTGGQDGWQPIFFDDPGDGCNTIDSMPYAYANVVGGVPTGSIFIPVFFGDGCIRVPQTGTVETVNGQVHFNGGYIQAGDLVTTIASVQDEYHLTITEPTMSPGWGRESVYGTDDHDAWEQVCRAHEYGTITFVGLSLTTRGIDCSNARFNLTGAGYGPFADAQHNSSILYAGKGRFGAQLGSSTHLNHDYILQVHSGWGVKIERMGFRGNTQAQPYGIVMSRGRDPLTGSGINQMDIFDQVWWGWVWGDSYETFDYGAFQLQSCLFADAFDNGNGIGGNVDFATVDHAYCLGAEVGFDANHVQATDWHFGKVHSQSCNIGTATWGGQTWADYYSEYNRLDISLGSPTNDNAPSVYANFELYGGESSTKAIEVSKYYSVPCQIGYCTGSAGIAKFNALGLGLPQWDRYGVYWSSMPSKKNPYINPTGVWVSVANIMSGDITFHGPIFDQATVNVRAAGTMGTIKYDFAGFSRKHLRWVPEMSDTGPYYLGLAGGRFKFNGPDTDIDIEVRGDKLPDAEAKVHDADSLFVTGSMRVESVPRPGYAYAEPTTAGSTSYDYQISCNDGSNHEGMASAILYNISGPFNNGPATLNDSTYNRIIIRRLRGCGSINLYGNEGSGAIGYLATVEVDDLPRGWPTAPWESMYLADKGQWTKDTNRQPPPTSKSGIVEAAGVRLSSLTNLSALATDNEGNIVAGVGGGPGGGGIASINGNTNTAQTIVQGSGINVSSVDGVTTITNTAQGGGDGGPFVPTGDLTGDASNILVRGLQGLALPSSPTLGYLKFNNTGYEWDNTIGYMNGLKGATATHTVDNANFYQSWLWAFSGTPTIGLGLQESSVSTSGSTLLYISSTGGGSTTIPLQVLAHYEDGMQVEGLTGNIKTLGTAKFVGPVQLPLINASLLGTDVNGNIIVGTGGGGGGGDTSLSSLTPATKTNHIDNGNHGQIWTWAFTSPSNIGMDIEESYPAAAAGSTMLAVSNANGSTTNPFSAMSNYTNGLRVVPSGDIHAVGTAKFVGGVQLPLANQQSLGTDASGNIVGSGANWSYSNTVVMSSSVNNTLIDETMAVPTHDADYFLTWQLQQIDAGSGGTCDAGALSVVLLFTPTVGSGISPQLTGHPISSGPTTNSFVAGMTVDETNYYVGIPFEFTARAGGAVGLRIKQIIASNCTTGQHFILRAHLKSW